MGLADREARMAWLQSAQTAASFSGGLGPTGSHRLADGGRRLGGYSAAEDKTAAGSPRGPESAKER